MVVKNEHVDNALFSLLGDLMVSILAQVCNFESVAANLPLIGTSLIMQYYNSSMQYTVMYNAIQ